MVSTTIVLLKNLRRKRFNFNILKEYLLQQLSTTGAVKYNSRNNQYRPIDDWPRTLPARNELGSNAETEALSNEEAKTNTFHFLHHAKPTQTPRLTIHLQKDIVPHIFLFSRNATTAHCNDIPTMSAQEPPSTPTPPTPAQSRTPPNVEALKEVISYLNLLITSIEQTWNKEVQVSRDFRAYAKHMESQAANNNELGFFLDAQSPLYFSGWPGIADPVFQALDMLADMLVQAKLDIHWISDLGLRMQINGALANVRRIRLAATHSVFC